jgi:uncharacterized membrane protein YkoI
MKLVHTIAIVTLLLGTAAPAMAKGTHKDLSKEAKISEPAARQIALARVPGTVQSEELELEHDRVVYSYDIKQPDKAGVEEVQVDAKTGKIVSVKHESEAKEKQEHDGK